MISYLRAVENLVDKPIYGRGVKTFLEGGIISYVDLTLDAWRKYQVKDTNTEVVVMPLLHLALNIQKWNQADQVIKESAFCSCQYFKEFGTCKHIVAVCASLEQEFIQPKNTKAGKQEIQNSLDTLFRLNDDKQQREWLNKFYQYFERSRYNLFPWISQVVRATSGDTDRQIFTEFWFGLREITKTATLDFDQEKKLINLITDSLITGSSVWYEFWLEIFPSLHPHNLVKVITSLWFQGYTLKHDFQDDLTYYIQNSKASSNGTLHNLSENILTELEQYPNSEKLKVEFALQVKDKDWLEKNMRNLDPLNLINMAINFPDLLESIELALTGILKVWSDFLTPQGTDELVEVMKTWRNKLGDTMEYQEMKHYLKQSYPKRKKLWSEL